MENLFCISTNDTKWKFKVKNFQPAIIIHLASYLTSLDDDIECRNLISSNIIFGTELLNTIDANHLKLFINTGSFSEFDISGNLSPTYFYSATKTAFCSILKYFQKKNNFKVANIIPYTIYGKMDRKLKLIDYIYRSSSSSEFVKMSPGKQVLDFIHIDDVVSGYLCVLKNFCNSELDFEDIHLGTGVGTTPKEIEMLIQNEGILTKIEWGGIPYRINDTMYSVAPNSPFFQKFRWAPKIDIKNGIRLYIKEMEKNGI